MSLPAEIGLARRLAKGGLNTIAAMFGPASVAMGHFVVSAALIPVVSPAEYGVFAFAMVVLQLATGFSDGLMGSPLAVLVNAHRNVKVYGTFCLVNLLFCTAAGLISLLVLLLFSTPATAALFSLFVATMSFRWFGRAFVISGLKKANAIRSDLVYSFTVVLSTGFLLLAGKIDLRLVIVAMTIASLISLPFLGRTFLQAQLPAMDLTLLGNFRDVWTNQARWSILSVAANAATIESHVFVVSFMAGPAAFAPVAVAALFFRPSLIGLYSLAQFERPRIAAALGRGALHDARRQTRNLALATGCLWLINTLAAYVISATALRYILGTGYEIGTVKACLLALAVVTLVRCLRQPLLTFLQAANRFRSIAAASWVTAPVSLLGAAAGLYLSGPVGSIYGLLTADLLLLVLILLAFLDANGGASNMAAEHDNRS